MKIHDLNEVLHYELLNFIELEKRRTANVAMFLGVSLDYHQLFNQRVIRTRVTMHDDQLLCLFSDECMRELRGELEEAHTRIVSLESRAVALERDRDRLEQEKKSSEQRALEVSG